jgi:CheY-like chemotaxis protein
MRDAIHAPLARRCPRDERETGGALCAPPHAGMIAARAAGISAATEKDMVQTINPQATTILIVDDQPDNREMLATLLGDEGYRTLQAASGMEAMDRIAQDSPQLILLDVSMPDMDGFAVASLLKADPKTKAIPIIMVTAHTGRGSRVVGLHTGAEDYLTKPVDAPELLLKIRNLLRLSQATPVSAARQA